MDDTTTTNDLAETIGLPKGTDVSKAIQSLSAPIETLLITAQAARGISFQYSGIDGDELIQARRSAILLQETLAKVYQHIGSLSAKTEEKPNHV